MADSLIVAGQIELLGAEGGVASQIPECAGAVFTLAPGYDLSAPQPTVDLLIASLLDGERPTGRRSSNRTISLPVKIAALDRATLAAGREILLALIDQDEWTLVWSRDGGLPMTFDCFRAAPAAPANDVLAEQQLVAYITITFPAAPYGRSDEPEVIQFPAPSQNFDPPPAPVSIDVFGTANSFLTGDVSTFEGSAGGWVAVANCTVARSTAQFHGGAASLALTATSAATMSARSDVVGDYATGIGVRPGGTLNVRGFSRAATATRSVNVGAIFFDDNGTQVGSILRGSNVTNSTTVFTTNPTAALTVPAGAVWALAEVQVVTPANGEVHYFDDITMDTGNAYSYDSPSLWAPSSLTPVTGHASAKWFRTANDNPIYDHILPAAVDITGRTKLTFWLGLANTAAQKATWNKGPVHFLATLTDAAGLTASFSARKICRASGLISQPHWQLVTMRIPQQSGIDMTQIKRYKISAYNQWNSSVTPYNAPMNGQPVLQATAYLAEVVATATATGPASIARGALFTFPAPVGAARSPLALSVAPGLSAYSTVVEFTTAGSNPWTAPALLTQVDKAEAWGAGGGGGGRNSTADDGGGGGGGGEYGVAFNVPVTAGNSYPATVGAAGTGGSPSNPGNPGGESRWDGNGGQFTHGAGGHPGWSGVTWGGGKGGSAGLAPKNYPGGDGHQSNANGDNFGGGGGGSGGTGSAGKDGSKTDRQGAGAVSGGGPGGDGGAYAGSPDNGSQPPTGPGGGGGGASHVSGGTGASGRPGKIRLTYGATGILPLSSLLLHTPGREEPPAYNPLCPLGGTGVATDGTVEYTVPAVGTLPARFDGSYTVYLVAASWSTPGSPRTITIVIKQYPYSSGTAITQTITRTITPNTDLPGTTFFVDLGAVTLPLNALPAGNASAYFAVTAASSVTADRFYDLLLLSSSGKTLLVNVAGSSIYQNIWVDAPDANRALGLVLGSNADRDQAFSITRDIERYSGGPMDVEPGIMNRLLAYSQQGCPGVTATYLPRWMIDRVG